MSRHYSARARRAMRQARGEAQESALVRRVLAGEQSVVGANELPRVDRALDCALPLFGSDARYPEWPQGQGTCIAMEFRGASFLLATKHEVDGAPPDGVAAPLGFGKRGISFTTWEGLARPLGVAWIRGDDAEDPDRFDLVLLPFDRRPRWTGDVRPLVLDTIANSDAFVNKALFAVAGYPRSPALMHMDYDRGELRRGRFCTLGFYEGPTAWQGCHTLEVDTSAIGGPDGLSGSPVLRVTYDDHHRVETSLAGIVVRGGTSRLHFIDVRFILQLVRSAGSRLGWPPDLRRP